MEGSLRELCLLSPLPLVYDERLGLTELLKSVHVMIESHDPPFRTDEKKYIVDAEGCVIYC